MGLTSETAPPFEETAMRSIIHAIDRLLRKCNGVFEYCDDPDCVFRVSIGVSETPSVPGL